MAVEKNDFANARATAMGTDGGGTILSPCFMEAKMAQAERQKNGHIRSSFVFLDAMGPPERTGLLESGA